MAVGLVAGMNVSIAKVRNKNWNQNQGHKGYANKNINQDDPSFDWRMMAFRLRQDQRTS